MPFKLDMGQTLGMIHPEAKFLPICGPRNLENELSASQVQWWGRHRTDNPKREKMEEIKESLV